MMYLESDVTGRWVFKYMLVVLYIFSNKGKRMYNLLSMICNNNNNNNNNNNHDGDNDDDDSDNDDDDYNDDDDDDENNNSLNRSQKKVSISMSKTLSFWDVLFTQRRTTLNKCEIGRVGTSGILNLTSSLAW